MEKTTCNNSTHSVTSVTTESVAVIVIGVATAILLGKKQDEHFAEEAAILLH